MSAFEQCDVCETPVVNLAAHKHRAHDIQPTARERTCAYCGGDFKPDHSDQRFCSPRCASRARQRGERA